MAGASSKITSKWQITIPEEVRREIPLEVGQRIVWEVQGDKLVGRRVRSIGELAGCLKSRVVPVHEKGVAGGFAKASIARHDRIAKQKH